MTSSSAFNSEDNKSVTKENFPKSEKKRTDINDALKIKPENQIRRKNSESENRKLEKPIFPKTGTIDKDSATEFSKKEVLDKSPKKSPKGENRFKLKTVKEVSSSEAETSKEIPDETRAKIPIETSTYENPEISEFDAEKDEEKKYFEKLSRILEKGEGASPPQEVQQIFLNEIQQWVADSPALNEENKVTEIEKINAVKLSPPEVIETLEKDSDFSEAEPPEQNLSLSIGKISIVIEDSEENVGAAEDLTNKNPTGNKVARTERKFSRLSRRYL